MSGYSEAREIYEDGGCCSCHLSPPCDFCVGMDEEEADVHWNDGMDGLRKLWCHRDSTVVVIEVPDDGMKVLIDTARWVVETPEVQVVGSDGTVVSESDGFVWNNWWLDNAHATTGRIQCREPNQRTSPPKGLKELGAMYTDVVKWDDDD